MSSFLEKFSVISPRQFGFVAGRGTITLLEEFADELYSAFECNLFACALFLDITKAFDSVCQKILLKKLYLLGFRRPFYDLLNQYLCGRFQVVATDKHLEFSTPLPLLPVYHRVQFYLHSSSIFTLMIFLVQLLNVKSFSTPMTQFYFQSISTMEER